MYRVLYLEGVLLRQRGNYPTFKLNVSIFFEKFVVILLIKKVPVTELACPSW
jgi:hypothetical protein